jgi:tRNA (cytidine32/uridine32-2'-O)-methyltransferase
MHYLQQIKVVLVRTFHPGNIGSSARAMKNMGLTKLNLVAPKNFPNEEANKMAAGAEDIIDSLTIHDSVSDAVADCTMIAATTARPRGYDLPEISPEECAQLVYQNALSGCKSAIIFGPERMGLHNDDLKQAKFRLTIPANPEYSSLNLAASVQLISYEIYKQHQAQSKSELDTLHLDPSQLATSADIERFYAHLSQTLGDIQFLRPHQGETMDRIRHLFSRAVLRESEIQILRGILSAVDRNITKKQ